MFVWNPGQSSCRYVFLLTAGNLPTWPTNVCPARLPCRYGRQVGQAGAEVRREDAKPKPTTGNKNFRNLQQSPLLVKLFRNIPRTSRLLLFGSAAFWLFIAFLNISQVYLSSQVKGFELDWPQTLLRNITWLIWVPLSLLVVRVVRRRPFRQGRPGAFLVYNLLWGVGFALLHFVLETAVKYPLWIAFIEPAPHFVNEFMGPIFYRFHLYFIIFLFIAGITHAFDAFSRAQGLELRNSRLESRLARAQLAALKAQLRPHFLFNTHQSIIGLIMEGQAEGAIEALTKLSGLLRSTLRIRAGQLVSLREELNMLSLYLDIYRLRLGGRLAVRQEVPRELLQAEVPPLILQPLVENAIRHGIEPFACNGCITIRACRQGEQLLLEVEDGGPGFPAEMLREGVGLKNCRERLRSHYGEQGHLSAGNRKGGGARVSLLMPLQWAGADNHF